MLKTCSPVVALVLGLCMASALPAGAQSSPSPAQLTALDYFEIQQLVAKYARAIDTCSNNGYDYADLFAEDGYFAPEVNGKVGNKAQGRERLAEISGGGSRGCGAWPRSVPHDILRDKHGGSPRWGSRQKVLLGEGQNFFHAAQLLLIVPRSPKLESRLP